MAKRKRTSNMNNVVQNTMQKIKNWAAQTPLKTGSELWCFGRVGSSCFTCGTRHVYLCWKPGDKSRNRIVIRTNGTYRCGHLWHKYSVMVNQVMRVTAKLLKWRLEIVSHERYIYSMCRFCWNVATHKRKVHNEKIEIISFVIKF